MISRRTGKRFIGKSDELIATEAYYISQMKIQSRCAMMPMPLTGPLWIVFHFIFSKEQYLTKLGRMKMTTPDLSNLYELPQDCLESANIITNDGQIWSHDLSRRRMGKETKLMFYIFSFNDFADKNESMISAF